MTQHTVPQNIMSVEFKIIGDLSIRQFIYVTIAGGLAFIFYLTYLPDFIKYSLITISILIGVLVTFARINERPFDQWINSFITAILMPTQRVWIKEHELPYLLEDKVVATNNTKNTRYQENNYQKVLSYINSRNLPTDEMYKANTVLDIEEIKMLTNIDKLMKSVSTIPPVTEPVVSPSTDGVPTVVNIQTSLPSPTTSVSVPPSTPSQTESIQPPPFPVSQSDHSEEEKPEPKEDGEPEQKEPEIRGQENIITIEPNTIVKLDELKNLQASSVVAHPAVEPIADPPQAVGEKSEESIVHSAKTEKTDIDEKASLTEDSPSGVDVKLKLLEEENQWLKDELLKTHEPQQEVESPANDAQNLVGHMPDFVRNPNIIYGVVVDSNEKLIEDVVVIIKDKSKRIMRAMKTNLLGQFYSRNPLVNGEYDVEANKERLVFDSVDVTLTGNIISPIIIRPTKPTVISSGQPFTLYKGGE